MDSITQIALGAAVGEATLGKRVGNKAPLLGAVVGTIPDLDVVFNPLLDPVGELAFHRGISHSIFFALVFSPFFGLFLSRIKGLRAAGAREWTLLTLWCILTHIALDCFTTFGTGVFEPFSSYRVEFSTIFVIDPLYTAPLLLCAGILMFFRRDDRRRRLLNRIGLVLSTSYLILTVCNKMYIDNVFEEALDLQDLPYSRFITVTTPFNNFLWGVTAQTDGGFWIGYYSLFDDSREIRFHFVPQNDQLLQPIRETEAVRRLQWFSKGYYCVRPSGSADTVVFNDMRFGQFGGWEDSGSDYAFMFNLSIPVEEGQSVSVGQIDPAFPDGDNVVGRFFQRVFGMQRPL